MNIRADYANLWKDGKEVRVTPEEVAVHDIILIKPGERVPLDGIVIEGSSALDTSALTGESLPRDAGVQDEVLAGVVNLSGVLKVEVSKPYGESTVSRILELVENASSKRHRWKNSSHALRRCIRQRLSFLLLHLPYYRCSLFRMLSLLNGCIAP